MIEHVRGRLSLRGRFTTQAGTLTFRTKRGQVIIVTLAPGGKFLQFVTHAIGLSSRLPAIRRAVEVIVSDARDLVQTR